MRVLHIIETLGIGGAEKDLIEKCLFLHKNIEFMVFCFHNEGKLAPLLREEGIKVISSSNKSKILSILKAPFKLREILNRYKVNVIHSHLSSGELVFCLYKLFFKTQVPAVSSVQSLRVQIRKRSLIIRKLLDYLVKRNYEKIIACSEAVRNELLNLNYPSNKVQVIFNGVNFSKFNIKKEDSGSEFIIGAIGRLSNYKGINYFIEAIPRVIRYFPDCIFWVIGDGEERKNLIELSEKLNIRQKVEFIPGVVNIGAYLSKLKILVVPSITEPLGIVAIEGLANKLPVIASNVDGLKEIIQDNKTGFLVSPKSPSAIAERIVHIINNYDRAKDIANCGYEEAKKRFEINIVANKLAELYHSICN